MLRTEQIFHRTVGEIRKVIRKEGREPRKDEDEGVGWKRTKVGSKEGVVLKTVKWWR